METTLRRAEAHAFSALPRPIAQASTLRMWSLWTDRHNRYAIDAADRALELARSILDLPEKV